MLIKSTFSLKGNQKLKIKKKIVSRVGINRKDEMARSQPIFW